MRLCIVVDYFHFCQVAEAALCQYHHLRRHRSSLLLFLRFLPLPRHFLNRWAHRIVRLVPLQDFLHLHLLQNDIRLLLPRYLLNRRSRPYVHLVRQPDCNQCHLR